MVSPPKYRVGARVLAGALLLALTIAPGCGAEQTETPGSPTATAANPTTKAAAPAAAAPPAAPRRDERPLPAFEGRLLDGQRRSISSFIGKRLLLFFFNPDGPDAGVVADAVAGVAAEQGRHNFQVVGVAMGSSPTKVDDFVREHGLDFPIFDDADASIAARLGLRSRLVLLGIDSEGYLEFGMGAFATTVPDAVRVVENDVRQKLRLPEAGATAQGALDRRPIAPAFEAPGIHASQERFRMVEHAGQPMILIFFLHTCPHCHHALRFFKAELAKLPADARPMLVGVSVADSPSAVRAMVAEEGLEDVLLAVTDPDQSARTAYGVFGGVPDIMLIDGSGRVVQRIQGWDETRDPAIARMQLAKIAGQPVPLILNPKGYTGSEVCGVCHEDSHQTWEFTTHSVAFDTLVTHGSDRDPECVGCHVVGYEQPGGWSLAQRPAHLEGVGCESCHGRGGPHLSPGFVVDDNYEPVCQTCHNPTHSLGFDYATFTPVVSHDAIAALDDAGREALLAGRERPRDVLGSKAEIVGSDACRDCHVAEFATWHDSPHGKAVESLAAKGEQENAECLKCHTTGFGRPGGFPVDAVPADHTDLARVGCESCHGPGGEHVKDGVRKLGSIVSLGDKCDSCVILQICGSCHDEANDPGFRFEVEARIEAQRHGTIEAGTGKPLAPQALRDAPPEEGLALAFDWLAEQRP